MGLWIADTEAKKCGVRHGALQEAISGCGRGEGDNVANLAGCVNQKGEACGAIFADNYYATAQSDWEKTQNLAKARNDRASDVFLIPTRLAYECLGLRPDRGRCGEGASLFINRWTGGLQTLFFQLGDA